MKNHAVSAKLPKEFSNSGKDLVIQFTGTPVRVSNVGANVLHTAKNERKEYSFCGGGYIKLLPAGLDQAKFGGDSPYSIMFGPDLCGYDVSRIHVIFTDKKVCDAPARMLHHELYASFISSQLW